MKYLPINNQLFINNRKRFSALLKPNSVAIFNSNDILPTNADGSLKFKQNSDLFYLSGIDQEESILVIYPDAKDGIHKEVLFLKETNEHIAIWEGHKLTKSEALTVSGIQKVYWLSEFKTVLRSLLAEAEFIYLNTNEHVRAVVETETREARFVKWCMNEYPVHKFERSAPLMHNLRAIKQDTEIELIQQACDITHKGFMRLLNFIKPGVWEYEIEAELIHEFTRNRSNGFAYTPIIASGLNSCVLHYIDNSLQCKDGDILLLDVAAEYANYNSDMTRSIPVNGKYTPRQKEVYNAVLRVMKSATKMLVPGTLMADYQKAVGQLMEEELIKLNLLSADDVKKQNPDSPLYKKYFMHGTSHYMGLDVHDVGNRYRKFEAGMVYTCEPGIYIPQESLGIRIENNILITDNGPKDLMANIPIEANDIEALMAK